MFTSPLSLLGWMTPCFWAITTWTMMAFQTNQSVRLMMTGTQQQMRMVEGWQRRATWTNQTSCPPGHRPQPTQSRAQKRWLRWGTKFSYVYIGLCKKTPLCPHVCMFYFRLGRHPRWRLYQRRTRVWSGACWSSCGQAWTCPRWCCPPSSWSHAPSWTNCLTTTTTPICSHSQWLKVIIFRTSLQMS